MWEFSPGTDRLSWTALHSARGLTPALAGGSHGLGFRRELGSRTWFSLILTWILISNRLTVMIYIHYPKPHTLVTLLYTGTSLGLRKLACFLFLICTALYIYLLPPCIISLSPKRYDSLSIPQMRFLVKVLAGPL